MASPQRFDGLWSTREAEALHKEQSPLKHVETANGSFES